MSVNQAKRKRLSSFHANPGSLLHLQLPNDEFLLDFRVFNSSRSL